MKISLPTDPLKDAYYWLKDLDTPKSYGKARFMRSYEMRRFMSANHDGICYSPDFCHSLEESFKGSATFAITGAGKTSSIQIPNTLKLGESPCSQIIIDAVDEYEKSVFALTAGYLHQQGFQIKPINLDDPQNSFHFNYLSYCSSTDDLKEIAFEIAREMAGKEPIWHIKSFELIYLVLSALARCGNFQLFNTYNAVWLLRNFGVNGEGIRDFMEKTLHPRNKHGSIDLWSSYLSFQNFPTETLQGFVATAIGAMYLWQESGDNISRLTMQDNLELDNIRNEKTAIYLILKKNRIKKYGVFLNLFISTLMKVLSNQGYKEGMLPVYLFLDEFGNLPAIDNFDGMVSTLRAYKVSINVTAQSISQLYGTYGEQTATTILDNLSNKLFLGGLNQKTCELVSKMLGYKTIQEVVEEKSEDGKQKFIIKGDPLMSPDQIRMLPKNHGIGIFGNYRPIYFNKLKGYYQYPHLLKRTKIAVPTLHFPMLPETQRVPLAIAQKWLEGS